MVRPKTCWRIARVALLALSRGATVAEAAGVAGVPPRSSCSGGHLGRHARWDRSQTSRAAPKGDP